MADSKITALTALTSADPANDMFPVVDVSDTTMAASGTTKRISINNILACSPSATLASATISGDLTVDTNVLKVDTTNNRVGIGTASPGYKLVLAAASGDVMQFENSSDSNRGGRITNTGTAGTGKFGITTTSSGYGLSFGIDAVEKMLLDTPGNLLVGTTNNFASSRLCVQGTAGTTTPDVTIGIPVNSSGNTGLAIGRSASTNGYIFLDAYKAAVGGTELVLNSINGGTVLIGLSTVVAAGGCLQLKSGVTFPATQVASSDANTLDDYEEGTWTGTLTFSTTPQTSTNTFTGRYTKVGRIVSVQGYLLIGLGGFVKGSASGTLTITGLPFTSGVALTQYQDLAASIADISSGSLCFASVSTGGAALSFESMSVSGAVVQRNFAGITAANFAATNAGFISFQLNITYTV